LDEIEYSDKACIFLRGIGFYDYNSPDGLKKSLPGKGLALEVTLEEVSLDAMDLLKEVEGVEFVIQRGERIRLLSNISSSILFQRVSEKLEKNHIAIHSIEYKVEIDMVDYFTFVSVIHNTQAQDITGKEVDSNKMKQIVQDNTSMAGSEIAIGSLPNSKIAVQVSTDGTIQTISKPAPKKEEKLITNSFEVTKEPADIETKKILSQNATLDEEPVSDSDIKKPKKTTIKRTKSTK
jgi:hypothetical protein